MYSLVFLCRATGGAVQRIRSNATTRAFRRGRTALTVGRRANWTSMAFAAIHGDTSDTISTAALAGSGKLVNDDASRVDFGLTRDGLVQLRVTGPRTNAAPRCVDPGISEHSGRYEHVGHFLAVADIRCRCVSTCAASVNRVGGGPRGLVRRVPRRHVEDQMAEVSRVGPAGLCGCSAIRWRSDRLSYALSARPRPRCYLRYRHRRWREHHGATCARLTPVLAAFPPRIECASPTKASCWQPIRRWRGLPR